MLLASGPINEKVLQEQHLLLLVLGPDLSGLHALLALLSDEAHGLSLLESLEALDLNGSEVDKQISTAIGGGDESVALLVVEPLDDAGLSVSLLVRHVCFSIAIW